LQSSFIAGSYVSSNAVTNPLDMFSTFPGYKG